METFENLPERNLSQLTSLLEDFPAKIYQRQDIDAESMRNEAVCGVTSHGLLGTFEPDTYSLRTSQVCLLTNQCDEYSGTFPRSGLMLDGRVFQRLPLVPLSYEIEFSYLPSPDASLGNPHGFCLDAWASTWLRKEQTGIRPSGARIGSSLGWCREYIREYLRTGGELNPEWIGALMGFPTRWNELSPTATPSCRK